MLTSFPFRYVCLLLVVLHNAPKTTTDYSAFKGLDVREAKPRKKALEFTLHPTRKGKDLELMVTLSNETDRVFKVPPLVQNRVSFVCTNSAGTQADIPLGLCVYKKNLLRKDLVKLQPGNCLSAKFVVPAFYAKKRDITGISAVISEYFKGGDFDFQTKTVKVPK